MRRLIKFLLLFTMVALPVELFAQGRSSTPPGRSSTPPGRSNTPGENRRNPVPVPEPATLLLLGAGAGALGLRKLWRNRR